MCTALTYETKDFYFGRNLDLECSYNERVVITPKNFELEMRHVESIKTHYAIIGMGSVINNYPLYFEGTNEKGLSMAGLNFPDNAVYAEYADNKDCITPFEFIPYVLAQCSCIEEAKNLLSNIQSLVMTPMRPGGSSRCHL